MFRELGCLLLVSPRVPQRRLCIFSYPIQQVFYLFVPSSCFKNDDEQNTHQVQLDMMRHKACFYFVEREDAVKLHCNGIICWSPYFHCVCVCGGGWKTKQEPIFCNELHSFGLLIFRFLSKATIVFIIHYMGVLNGSLVLSKRRK